MGSGRNKRKGGKEEVPYPCILPLLPVLPFFLESTGGGCSSSLRLSQASEGPWTSVAHGIFKVHLGGGTRSQVAIRSHLWCSLDSGSRARQFYSGRKAFLEGCPGWRVWGVFFFFFTSPQPDFVILTSVMAEARRPE